MGTQGRQLRTEGSSGPALGCALLHVVSALDVREPRGRRNQLPRRESPAWPPALVVLTPEITTKDAGDIQDPVWPISCTASGGTTRSASTAVMTAPLMLRISAPSPAQRTAPAVGPADKSSQRVPETPGRAHGSVRLSGVTENTRAMPRTTTGSTSAEPRHRSQAAMSRA